MTKYAPVSRTRRILLPLTALVLAALWLCPLRAEAGLLGWLLRGRRATPHSTTDLSVREQRAHWSLRNGHRPADVRRRFGLGRRAEERIIRASPANTRWDSASARYRPHKQWKRRVR